VKIRIDKLIKGTDEIVSRFERLIGRVPVPMQILRVFIGGALVMGAVIADIVGDIRAQRRPR
jgi:hypothetical protein